MKRDLPEAVRRAFSDLPETEHREVILFRDAVARRVLDAMGHVGPTRPAQAPGVIREARRWLRMGPDRDALLSLADLEPGPWIASALKAGPSPEEIEYMAAPRVA